MATPEYIDATNFAKGVTAAEAGINIESFTQRWENPREYVQDKVGSNTGFVHNFNPSSTCTISGEINVAAVEDSLGVAWGVAETVANAVDGFGVTAGDWFLDSPEYSANRGSLQTFSADLIRHPEITVA
jgi:hypothetical protein